MHKEFQTYQLFFVLFCMSIFISPSIALGQNSLAPLIIDAPTALDPIKNETKSIVGVRETAKSVMGVRFIDVPKMEKSPTYFIPEKMLIDSWFTDETFDANAQKLGITKENATIEMLKQAGIAVEKFKWDTSGNKVNSVIGKVIELEKSNKHSQINYDAAAIIAMTASNVLDISKTYSSVFSADSKFVAMDAGYAKAIKTSNYYATDQASYSDSLSNNKWETRKNAMIFAAASFPMDFKANMEISLGKVTYGKLRIRTADEVGFKIDIAINRNYDVYLVEFSATFRELPIEFIEEVSFRVNCSKDCIAWELAPLSITANEQRTTTINTPEISFQGVSLGTFFKKEIVSVIPKPQIIAFGLRENSFSWALKDAAISTGSHKFLAAIGFPKGTSTARFARSVGLRAKDTLQIEGKWADTDIVYKNITLP